ncbi:hypothetical protein ES703_85025 [subsurface metagenome]
MKLPQRDNGRPGRMWNCNSDPNITRRCRIDCVFLLAERIYNFQKDKRIALAIGAGRGQFEITQYIFCFLLGIDRTLSYLFALALTSCSIFFPGGINSRPHILHISTWS